MAPRNGLGVIKTFRDLAVWQKSMSLVVDIYKATKYSPKKKMFDACVKSLRREGGAVVKLGRFSVRNQAEDQRMIMCGFYRSLWGPCMNYKPSGRLRKI